MIAQRFRALGWVAGISSAACGLYLISLQVAAERAKLEDVDKKIAAAERDMRALQTELGTRANMRQLQKWNDDVLSLAAPRAAQYLTSEHQLAALEPGMGPAAPGGTAPQSFALVAATPTASKPLAAKPVQVAQSEFTPASAPIRAASFDPAQNAKLQRVAMTDRAMLGPKVLGRGTLGDLVKTAAEERRKDR